jgi:hypothetical protein
MGIFMGNLEGAHRKMVTSIRDCLGETHQLWIKPKTEPISYNGTLHVAQSVELVILANTREECSKVQMIARKYGKDFTVCEPSTSFPYADDLRRSLNNVAATPNINII